MEVEQQQKDDEFQKLKESKFKQQKLPAWRPVPTVTSTTVTFVAFVVVFLVLGVIIILYSNDIKEHILPYDKNKDCESKLNSGTPCEIEFEIKEPYKAPIIVYYYLENFYQNHRRYVKSKSNSQLNGKNMSVADIESDCEPIIKNKDVGKTLSIGNIALDPEAPANPCGLIAKSLFNDTYQLLKSDGNSIFINETNIAWSSDKELKYKNPENAKAVLWTDNVNEHFIVWMRPAGLPNFRKLWGRINQNLPAGKYKVKVNNNYPVKGFQGSKHFIISTVNALGGKNNFLGISYLVVGSLCLVMAILFLIGYKANNRQKQN